MRMAASWRATVEGAAPDSRRSATLIELVEEAGLDAGGLELLIELYPSPGLTDSVTTVFLATDCTPTERSLQGPEEEHSELLHLPLDDAVRLVLSGDINDAKTVIGLLLTERRLRTGDAG